MDKPLRVHAELVIFKENHIKLSQYHGCVMEGSTIRRLMMNGPKVFAKIAKILKASLGTDPSCVATDDNIEEFCSSYGQLYLLLDTLFSFIYNIKNRKATIVKMCVLR